MSFPGLAHRMETVGRIGRVRFVNDCKATNADAARQALSSYPKFYWIAGGQPKDGGIDDLRRPLPPRRQGLSDRRGRRRLRRDPGRQGPVAPCGRPWRRAVGAASADAAASGQEPVVLLSPACASLRPVPRLRGARRGLPRRRPGASRRGQPREPAA